jgi:hypothetical protein
VDGAGAESFRDFIHRAQSFIDRLVEHPARDVAVFSHGQVINAVAWLIERRPQQIDGRAMADWREYEITNHVPNGGGYVLTKSSDDAAWRLSRESRVEPSVHDTPRVQGRARARSPQAASGSENTPSELSAREICQVLRDVTFKQRRMTKVHQPSWDEVYAGHFLVDIDGWQVSIFNDCDTLDYCEECLSPDGRRWTFNAGDRYGTDPVSMLSTYTLWLLATSEDPHVHSHQLHDTRIVR